MRSTLGRVFDSFGEISLVYLWLISDLRSYQPMVGDFLSSK